jgi:hypothetical protein
MSDLYGIDCARCNKEIAAALRDMPLMPGYLGTDDYAARYHRTPMPWPKPYVDGEYKPETTATVIGEDGWLLCLHRDESLSTQVKARLCSCGSDSLMYELWRGRVEIK